MKKGVILASVTIIIVAVFAAFLLFGSVHAGGEKSDAAANSSMSKGEKSEKSEIVISQKGAFGNWKERFSDEFPIKYGTKKFRVSKFAGEVNLRINEKGGEFSDVDAITLRACGRDINPRSAIYTSDNSSVLGDILAVDNNVAILHGEEIEISWDVPKGCFLGAMVYITANEYGTSRPFVSSSNYRLLENKGRIFASDLENGEKNMSKFLVDSWDWKPETGHPDGTTYAYASDNSGYLYLVFDVTADNTNDYGKDWAEVTIKTKFKDEKVFYIDDFKNKYGHCDFGTTDKVPYRHQICEFAIPKDEIGGIVGTFEFALKYYGTAGGGGVISACGTVLATPANYSLTQSISAEGTCLDIITSDISINCKGYTIYYGSAGLNGSAGITAIGMNNVTIINCTIIKTAANGTQGYGIWFTSTNNSLIENVTIKTNGTYDNDGIVLDETCMNATIRKNTIFIDTNSSVANDAALSTGNWGIWLDYAEAANVTGNIITTNGTGRFNYGIYSSFGRGNNVTNNTINTNGVSYSGYNYGIYSGSDFGCHYNGNRITTNGNGSLNYGIYVSTVGQSVGIHSVNLYNNTIVTNGTFKNYGIYVSAAYSSMIYNNTIYSNGSMGMNYGIFLDKSGNSSIVYNNIYSNGTNSSHALYLAGAVGDSNISYNSFSARGKASAAIRMDTTPYYVATQQPENCVFRNNSFGDVDGLDLNVSESVNGSQFIDNPIRSYGFTGRGSILSVKNTKLGYIEFTNTVNGSGTNFSADIQIGLNFSQVDSNTNPGLNRSANITMLGLVNDPLSTPAIYRDDSEVCPVGACYNYTSLNAGTVKFNVTSWTNYTIRWIPAAGGSGTGTTTHTPSGSGGGSVITYNNTVKVNCTSNIQCGSWGTCKDKDSFADIFNNAITITSEKTRTCNDLNKCKASYSEKASCAGTTLKLTPELTKEYLVLINNLNGEPNAKINLEALREGRLEVSFVQSQDSYAATCYNGILDTNEEKIDCGGVCKACDNQNIIFKYLSDWPWWLLFLLLVIAILYFYARTQEKYKEMQIAKRVWVRRPGN